MPSKQVLKETYDRWYAKGLLHLAKQEWEEARLCFNSCARALIDLSARSSGETKELQQSWLLDLASELTLLEKKVGMDRVSEKLATNQPEENDKTFTAHGIPDTSFDDVVGLDEVKSAVFLKAIYPRLYPELYYRYKMRTGGGLLLYGLPGTGKTMIAQAVAHETHCKFFSVRCSDLGSKWFGETEQNIRNVFEEARSCENAVLFFDEIEAYAAKRREDTAMGRVVPEFLTQLQAVSDDKNKNKLLVIAATNRPWDIDGAFLRPGRFDDKVYVPLPNENVRKIIMQKHMEGVPTQDVIDFDDFALRTEGYNGADVSYVCDKAKEIALRRVIEELKDDKGVSRADFEKALAEVKSSVNLEDEKRMKTWVEESV